MSFDHLGTPPNKPLNLTALARPQLIGKTLN
jgi:hypothetical protein